MDTLTNDSSQRYSPHSLQAGLSRPGHAVLCSTKSSWRSLLLQKFEQPAVVDEFETKPSPDPLLVFCLQGDYTIQSCTSGRWQEVRYRAGVGGFTAPHTQNRLRWHSNICTTISVLRLYIPEHYLLEATEELRPSFGRSTHPLPDSLGFADDIAFAVARSLLQRLSEGAPDLYADAGSRFLAAHLVRAAQGWSTNSRVRSTKPIAPSKRPQRAHDYMCEHFRQELTLERLAQEAGISPFHFAREYKARFGYTPHRHQVMLRMQHAKTLLLERDFTVQEVASECGYTHGGHFAAAFRAEFGTTPTEFRRRAGV